MKKMMLPMLALVLFGFSRDTGKLTEEERKMANQHLA